MTEGADISPAPSKWLLSKLPRSQRAEAWPEEVRSASRNLARLAAVDLFGALQLCGKLEPGLLRWIIMWSCDPRAREHVAPLIEKLSHKELAIVEVFLMVDSLHSGYEAGQEDAQLRKNWHRDIEASTRRKRGG